MAKTSEAKAKVTLDSAQFEKAAKAIADAAQSMSATVGAAMVTAGTALLAVFGAKGLGAIVDSAKGVLDLGEAMANAGKRAGLAAGQFMIFHDAMEKGVSRKTMAGLIGDNAAVLDRSAGMFRDVTIKLWAVGQKIQGFWLGLMERVSPVLSKMLDGALAVSLVNAGQKFGGALANAVKVFTDLSENGKLGDTFMKAVETAFKYAGERMVWLGNIGFSILKVTFSDAFEDGVSDAIASVWKTVKDFAKNFGDLIANAFLVAWTGIIERLNGFVDKIDKVLYKAGIISKEDYETGKAEAARENAHLAAQVKPIFNPKAAQGRDFGAIFRDVFAKNQFKPSEGLAKLMNELGGAFSKALNGYDTSYQNAKPTSYENTTRRAAFGADSLAAIGGGGGVYTGLSVLDVQKSQLAELKQMNQTLSSLATGGVTTGHLRSATNTDNSWSVSRFQKKPPLDIGKL